MINFPAGFTDYACNTQGPMLSYQLYQRDSAENAENFIQQFKIAIENGMNPNDSDLQNRIFNSGSLRFDELLDSDKNHVIKEVEKAYASKRN